MKSALAVFRKELYIAFTSPIFYTSSFIFLLVSGYFFYNGASYFNILSFQASRNPLLAQQLNLTNMVIKPFFGDIAIIFLLMLPLITMRIYAEEKKSGTIELLFTYPITDMAALCGKFCATLLILLAMLSGTAPYMIMMGLFGNPDWGVVIGGYLGLVLMGSSFLALGIFTSSLTENQIVAAVISFGALLLLFVINWSAISAGPSLGPVLEYLSIMSHFEPFTRGLIDTRDIVFYLLFIFFWLFLTHRFLKSRFWRG